MSISLTQVQPGCFYMAGPTMSVATTSGSRWICGAIGPMSPSGNVLTKVPLLTIKDGITTGGGNRYGDNACQHIAWSGDLSFSGVRITPDMSNLQPFYWMQGTTSGFNFSHWLADGDDFLMEFPDISGRNVTVRMAYKAGTALVGWFLPGELKSQGKMYVKVWSYFPLTTPTRAFQRIESYGSYASLSMLTSYPLTYSMSGSTVNLPRAVSAGSTTTIPNKKQFLGLLGEMVNLSPDEPFDMWRWGDLAAACADQRRYVKTNTLQYLSDMQDVTRLLPQLGKLDNPKTWAKLYLWYKYSFSTNISDTKALTEAIQSAKHKFRHEVDKSVSTYSSSSSAASNSVATSTWLYHYKLTTGLAESTVGKILTHLDEWGLNPNTEIVWDFIPYSFVVDWFTGLGSLFRALDDDWRLHTYPVLAVCKSTKHEVHFNSVSQLGIPGLSGSLSYKNYTRTIQPEADFRVCRIDSPGHFRNYLEAASLLISKSNWR